MKVALLTIGILATLIGLLWIGQGTGLFPYPASSFMIADMHWALYGAVLAVIGVAAILYSRR